MLKVPPAGSRYDGMAVSRAPHTTSEIAPTARRRSLLVSGLALVAVASLLTSCLSNNQTKTLGQLNTDRNAHSLRSLSNLDQASSKAQRWADHLASVGYLAHTSLASGYTVGWCNLGENVGYGPDTASIERAFMASTGHRANILGTAWNHAGTGVARNGSTVYVVQEFIKTC